MHVRQTRQIRQLLDLVMMMPNDDIVVLAALIVVLAALIVVLAALIVVLAALIVVLAALIVGRDE